jgi:hypothetical protein
VLASGARRRHFWCACLVAVGVPVVPKVAHGRQGSAALRQTDGMNRGVRGDGEVKEGALRAETAVISLGRPAAVADGPLNVPITPASALQAGGVSGYARDGHVP